MSEKTPYKIKKRYKLLVKIVIGFIKWRYNLSANVAPEVKQLKGPYLLLPNHYGRYDPFILAYFLFPYCKSPNFVSSDAILRDPIYGKLFSGLGAIPKKKGVRDTQVIREMVKVVERGNPVALFAEGSRSWSGVSNYIDPSIAKLVKLLKVPVVTAKMKGASVFDPRWAERLRRAHMVIDYKLTITEDELADLSEDEIMMRLLSDIHHDDVEYVKTHPMRVRSNRRAEYIERIFFQCPECNKYAGFDSYRNQFACNACGYQAMVNTKGMITSKFKRVYFTNARDWLQWQNQNFISHIKSKLEQQENEPVFSAKGMLYSTAVGNDKMQDKGVGIARFYTSKIVFELQEQTLEFTLEEIDSLSAQYLERVEFYVGEVAHRLTSTKHKESGLKWEIAVNTIWYYTNQQHKLSPYLKNLFEAKPAIDLGHIKRSNWSTRMEF
ncbi:MAG: 1-acyl-sn-glycerol-3-phosphate acyltransferase [Cyclobacteriaceae bacterium]|nr:1-acyl-sn-glycerol-3-phosphate acyltransferase [Cyclobacteriaceae bacterium]